MSRLLLSILILTAILCGCTRSVPTANGPVPSESQLEWHRSQYYMFIHFSINTFTDMEWGLGNENPALFDPTDIDVEQWARVAKDAGMKGIIITAKHHDGFCLWPSAFTEHSLKNSPYKDGKGDIIRELRDACDKYDLRMGIYLSPWDRNHADYGSDGYITYYRSQLSELLQNYGEIFEVWFDGANGGYGYYDGAWEDRSVDRKTYYDWQDTWDIVRKLQPLALMFSDAGPDIRWVGNESGMAGPTNWAMLRRDEFYPGSPNYTQLGEGHIDGTHWVPAEVDVSIRPGWFYHSSEDDLVKTPEELMDIYYSSIGRNGNLLMNVPPDRTGLINDIDIKSLMEFRKLIEREFAIEIAEGKKVYVSDRWSSKYKGSNICDGDPLTFWTPSDDKLTAIIQIDFGDYYEFNRVLLQEYIPLGQQVKEFIIEAYVDNNWKEVSGGTTIGNKVIKKFPLILSDKIRIIIKDSRSRPAISNIEVYSAPGN